MENLDIDPLGSALLKIFYNLLRYTQFLEFTAT